MLKNAKIIKLGPRLDITPSEELFDQFQLWYKTKSNEKRLVS